MKQKFTGLRCVVLSGYHTSRSERLLATPTSVLIAAMISMVPGFAIAQVQSSYPGTVPGTGQARCYDDAGPIACPDRGQPYFGQEPGFRVAPRGLRAHDDATVSDEVTGLTWTRAWYGPMSWAEAQSAAAALRLGGHKDWRLPSIKELYTLMDFGRGYFSATADTSVPFIDTSLFDFSYATGTRFIDVQEWSATPYVATTMNRDATIFGVNFADGRIKGYPLYRPGSGGRQPQVMRARFVRGPGYALNRLTDQGDGTVTDASTGLMWQKRDDGVGRNWRDALAYCASLTLAGHHDWRLPHAKELHTVVDYTHAPAATGSAALVPPLQTSIIESYFWTATTIADGPSHAKYDKAVYFAFGRALGWMALPPQTDQRQLMDVHGAGAQRADFKAGDPTRYPQGFGPQGDEVRILNQVRCVRRL